MSIKVPPNYVEVDGDLLTFEADYIGHQCNCTTTDVAGLAKVIFARHPDANTYRHESTVRRVVGTASIHGRVVNLYAQRLPGRARPPKPETYADRLSWLRAALEHAHTQIGREVYSLAVPHFIGCALAGGNWDDYRGVLMQFAHTHSGVTLTVVKLVQ